MRASLWVLVSLPQTASEIKKKPNEGIPVAIFLDYGLAIGGGAYRVQALIYSLRAVHADLL